MPVLHTHTRTHTHTHTGINKLEAVRALAKFERFMTTRDMAASTFTEGSKTGRAMVRACGRACVRAYARPDHSLTLSPLSIHHTPRTSRPPIKNHPHQLARSLPLCPPYYASDKRS